MDLDRYLDRIGLDRPEPTAAGLAALQAVQMRAISFENIDPLLGVVPDVTLAGISDKVLGRGRGGYCFELNTLFGAAMAEFGFTASRIMARVRLGAPEGRQRSHLAWLVEIDGEEWLADTGLGGPGAAVPLRVAVRDAQSTPSGNYRLREDAAAGELVLERETPEGWFSLFGFDRVPVRDADIEAANFVTARWEKAPFPSNLMLSRHTEDGRVSLNNTALRIESRNGVSKRGITSADELRAVLADDFALQADHAMSEAIWRRFETLGHVERPAG